MYLCPSCNATISISLSFCGKCGARLKPLLPNDTLRNKRYVIINRLGRGGMSTVYLAKDTTLFDRNCVIKDAYYENPTEKKEVKESFEKEAKLLASLKHSNIPHIYDYFEEAEHYYFVMEFIDGENLEDRLSRTGVPLPEKDVIEYSIQICGVLDYISNQTPPIVHRDIKPANIIIEKSSGLAKLVDFGIAKMGVQTSASGTLQMGTVFSAPRGTIGYAPPEQYDRQTEPRSDIFALGATMHHLLTNRDPRIANAKKTNPTGKTDVDFTYPPLEQYGISSELGEIVKKALEYDVNKRFTAMEMKNELVKIVDYNTTKLQPQSIPFVFSSKFTVLTIEELVDVCQRHKNIAIKHLYNGNFESWLKSIGRKDIAKIASKIRTSVTPKKRGLYEFLESIDTYTPTISVEPKSIILSLTEDELKSHSGTNLTIINSSGKGYVSGRITTSHQWMELSKNNFWGDKTEITITINPSLLPEGKSHNGIITISTKRGHQREFIPVKIDIIPEKNKIQKFVKRWVLPSIAVLVLLRFAPILIKPLFTGLGLILGIILLTITFIILKFRK